MFDGFVDKLQCIDLVGLDRKALVATATDAGQLRGALDAFDVRVAAAIDALDDDGLDAAETLRTARMCSKREGRRIARRAETMKNLPSVQQALADGDITAEHADALARAADDTSPEAVEKAGLVDRFARGRPADIADRDVRTWAARHEAICDKEQRYRNQRKARKLSIFDGDGGMKIIHGELDPVAGVQLEDALKVETNRLYHLDGGRDAAIKARSDEQRRADALVNIVTGKRPGETAGTTTNRVNGTPSRPAVVVCVDAGVIAGTDPDGRCEIPGVGHLPRTVLERLACDADLFGLIFSGPGDPLWMSRRTRTVTNAQYRALVVRDGGCVICNAKPWYCEAHHIVPWAPPANGPTDIDNLALVCVRHHHQLHDHDQSLTRAADGQWNLAPP